MAHTAIFEKALDEDVFSDLSAREKCSATRATSMENTRCEGERNIDYSVRD